MRFVVSLTDLGEADATVHALMSVQRRVELGAHVLEIADADLLEQHAWYRVGTETQKQYLRGAAEAMSWGHETPVEGPHLRAYEIRDAGSALGAEKLANTPLTVVVENKVSDGALIKCIARLLGTGDLKDLWFNVHLDPAAVDVRSGGGDGEVLKEVDVLLGQASERGRPARVFVLADSDGEIPGHIADTPMGIERECRETRGVPAHILKKRTAENYIPDSVWQALASRPGHEELKPAVEALLRLTAEQRDHVNMGDKSPWYLKNPGAAALFAGVSEDDRRLLKHDFKGSGAKMKILKLIDPTTPVTADDLRARDGCGELDALIKSIAAEL